MNNKVESLALNQARKQNPLIGILRLKDPEVQAVKLGGIQPRFGILEDEDILDLDNFEQIQEKIRKNGEELDPVKRHKSTLSSSEIEILIQITSFDHFSFTQNPEKNISIAFIATDRKNTKTVKRKIRRLEELSREITQTSSAKKKAKLLEKYHGLRGNLFGYPQCDVEFFAERFSKLGSEKDLNRPEKIVVEDFMENSWEPIVKQAFSQDENFRSFLRNPPREFYSLPTLSFYPHRSDCEKAIQSSKRALGEIELQEAEDLYSFEIFFHHLEIIRKQYGNSRDRDKVRKFFNRLNSTEEGKKCFKLIKELQDNHYRENYNILFEKFMNRN